ncbi:MAG TPA: L-threonylcarbamoyladenylate synthase [Phycisphaerales bacterium]|nr:L-threonylcarbamoyladenylate synthase [Phycisphaerales bacterium]
MPADAAISAAVAAMKDGRLVAFPTETVYGLGADALDASAVARVFALKGRPANNPLIVHVCDEAMARSLVKEWPAAAAALAKSFWPGPLSIVLPRAASVPGIVTAGSPNVAVRCPRHPLTLALIRALGRPLVGPSANASGHVSPTTAAHARAEFDARDVHVLDGGPCEGGIESTVVTLAESPPRVLRPGLISAEEIARVLGTPVTAPREGAAAHASVPGTPLESPGLLEKHYAPRTRAVMIPGKDAPAFLRRAVGKVVLLTHHACDPAPPPHEVVALPADAHAYAAAVYAALRDADSRGAGVIAVVKPEDDGAVWDAVRDRLRRATAE